MTPNQAYITTQGSKLDTIRLLLYVARNEHEFTRSELAWIYDTIESRLTTKK